LGKFHCKATRTPIMSESLAKEHLNARLVVHHQKNDEEVGPALKVAMCRTGILRVTAFMLREHETCLRPLSGGACTIRASR
jgi:hypothetical protein